MCGPESLLPIITEFFRDIRSIREEQNELKTNVHSCGGRLISFLGTLVSHY